MQIKLLSGFTPSYIIHLDINNKWPSFYTNEASGVYLRHSTAMEKA